MDQWKTSKCGELGSKLYPEQTRTSTLEPQLTMTVSLACVGSELARELDQSGKTHEPVTLSEATKAWPRVAIGEAAIWNRAAPPYDQSATTNSKVLVKASLGQPCFSSIAD